MVNLVYCPVLAVYFTGQLALASLKSVWCRVTHKGWDCKEGSKLKIWRFEAWFPDSGFNWVFLWFTKWLEKKRFWPTCSKCPTTKTALRPVSIQVQLVSYESQHRNKGVNYQCQTHCTYGHNLFSYQCKHGHKRANYQCQTTGHNLFSYLIN